MIVPVEILLKLKCSKCEDLLSCGPVLLKQDGKSICGRCSTLDKRAVPNMPYNELAEMCAFPCKYESKGCYEKVTFDSMKEHEADCGFRSYICPVMPSGSCDWIGTRNKILEHTQEAHPEKILQHPCEMEHDVKTASLKTYLTTAFNILFLILTKVSLTTYTIYNSVRKIGEIDNVHKYKYEFKVENECGILIRKSEVAPQGCLDIKINSMMDNLKGFKDSKFLVTIYEYLKCFICNEIKIASEFEICDKINQIYYCLSCSSTLNSCKNSSKGCLWKGTDSLIHDLFFCSFSKWCDKCNCKIKESYMLDHIRRKSHRTYQINHLYKRYWTINMENDKENVTISFKGSSYLLTYKKIDDVSYNFGILGSYNNVRKMKCYLILRNSNTNYLAQYIMRIVLHTRDGLFMGYIELYDDTLNTFIVDKKFDVGVDIYCYE